MTSKTLRFRLGSYQCLPQQSVAPDAIPVVDGHVEVACSIAQRLRPALHRVLVLQPNRASPKKTWNRWERRRKCTCTCVLNGKNEKSLVGAV
eukprot:1360108-Rhodomonas_salina.1